MLEWTISYLQCLIFSAGPGTRRDDVKIHLHRRSIVDLSKPTADPRIGDRLLLLSPMANTGPENRRYTADCQIDQPTQTGVIEGWGHVLFDVMGRSLGEERTWLHGRNRLIHTMCGMPTLEDRAHLQRTLAVFLECTFRVDKIEGRSGPAMIAVREVVSTLAKQYNEPFIPAVYAAAP